LKGEAAMPTHLTQAEKREMVDKAKSAIVLCLGDKVLRDVARKGYRGVIVHDEIVGS